MYIQVTLHSFDGIQSDQDVIIEDYIQVAVIIISDLHSSCVFSFEA